MYQSRNFLPFIWGRIRTEIKKHLSEEIKAINKLVKKVLAS